MPSLITYIQWGNYAGEDGMPPLFGVEPLAYNSNQDRLHLAEPGDTLWLVSRCPEDKQYYLVAKLTAARQERNGPESDFARLFGQYRLVMNRTMSRDLNRSVPAEGVLRAMTFDPAKPVRHGSSLGQSLQSVRMVSSIDEELLESVVARLDDPPAGAFKLVRGLWTKCDLEYAEYFRINAAAGREPQAFLLYDPPPSLPDGAPVFIHSDKAIRLIARYRASQFVAGHRFTCDAVDRDQERERIWRQFREGTINSPDRAAFDRFWIAQNGVRALLLLDQFHWLVQPLSFKSYSRVLDWGYPTGVGYRYLSHWQCACLSRWCGHRES
jgi:hypothetical protein